ncbi:TPA: putrescine ABC transporter permease PotH [Escherichia coli]|nr:putrescine ABC transporter permease PotH [Escherichia coli]EFJ8626474.1 putrescine ABC transporter permease PotH [Escherichia coli]EFJ8936739.1 putrescine ABC transporter permease PotH [Escherichia coli]GCK23757.1 putrescine ABC transporter permease [Escherichia coli]
MSTLEPAAQSKPPGGFKLWLSQLQMKHGRKLVIALPYIWLILLFLLPFLIVFKISLAEMARAIPPYTELMEWADGQLSITLNLGNFLQLTDDPLYFDAYLQSLQVAAISTFCCLLIGYPLAWAVAHSKPSTRNILLLLVILPSWTSFLIRVYAWMGILKNNGVLNNFLLWLGVIDQPLTILHTNLAVYIGIVYAYVPFMVLPIYTALIRIDYSLVEAALDLGARPLKTFFTVIVPLTKGGIIAGSMLVFIPAVGEFVIPELLGGPDSIMIGRVLWQEFFNNRDWPVASAVAIIMLLLLVIYSFNSSKLVTVWAGWSTRWYGELLRDDAMMSAVGLSLTIAACAATAAAILGTIAAVVLVRFGRFRGSNGFAFMITAPLVMPDVITGLSLLLLFVALAHAIGWPADRGMLTIWLAHVTFCTAYVAVVISSRLRELDRSIEEAAMDLGATPLKVFFVITLPMIMPAIISGWLLAFTLSLDDLVIASFVSGPGATTLPMLVFSSVRMGVNPEINALATLILGAVGIVGFIAWYLMARAEKQRIRDIQRARHG